jgi:hypothetical protein
MSSKSPSPESDSIHSTSPGKSIASTRSSWPNRLQREVFDANAWERITDRAKSIKLQVRPEMPPGLNVNLRPYQIEGFHFLAYLATNHFGGILADDMGLGKTIQSLTWLLWLRESCGDEDPAQPCGLSKSVLDVWGDEVKKASPSIRVQVLRNKSELEVERLGTEIDLLVINYSQLRTCADELKGSNGSASFSMKASRSRTPTPRPPNPRGPSRARIASSSPEPRSKTVSSTSGVSWVLRCPASSATGNISGRTSTNGKTAIPRRASPPRLRPISAPAHQR